MNYSLRFNKKDPRLIVKINNLPPRYFLRMMLKLWRQSRECTHLIQHHPSLVFQVKPEATDSFLASISPPFLRASSLLHVSTLEVVCNCI